MRDVIWTLIIIWAIYKILDVFKAVNVKRTTYTYNTNRNQYQNPFSNQNTKREGTVSIKDTPSKSEMKPNPNITDGEYVDFEEIK
ncbi:MAG: DUF4834 family protein [Bacteroidia bacterium]